MNQIPCPGRIFFDLGDAFTTGCAFGSIWYLIKGAYFSVRKERLKGGLVLLRSRAPVLGGSFAMWGFIFSITCCGMIAIRQREDPINSVVAGFTTGFVLAIRAGFRSAFRNGMIGGIFLAIMELIMVIQMQMQKREQLNQEKKMIEEQIKQIEKMYGVKIKRDDKQGQSSKLSDKNIASDNDNMVFSNAPARI